MSLGLKSSQVVLVADISNSAPTTVAAIPSHRNLLVSKSFVVSNTIITTYLSQFPHFSGNESEFVPFVFSKLFNAVHAGNTTFLFRRKLKDLKSFNDSFPAVLAVALGSSIAVPTSSPVRIEGKAGTGLTVTQSLLIGLLVGVFALTFTSVPVYMLLRYNMKKKEGKEKEAAAAAAAAADAEEEEEKHRDINHHIRYEDSFSRKLSTFNGSPIDLGDDFHHSVLQDNLLRKHPVSEKFGIEDDLHSNSVTLFEIYTDNISDERTELPIANQPSSSNAYAINYFSAQQQKLNPEIATTVTKMRSLGSRSHSHSKNSHDATDTQLQPSWIFAHPMNQKTEEEGEVVESSQVDSRQLTDRQLLLKNNAKTFAYYNGLYDGLFDENAAILGDDSSEEGSILHDPEIINREKEKREFENLLNEVKTILSGSKSTVPNVNNG